MEEWKCQVSVAATPKLYNVNFVQGSIRGEILNKIKLGQFFKSLYNEKTKNSYKSPR